MAKSGSIKNSIRKTPPQRTPMVRRAVELGRDAAALLAVPEAFWRQLPGGSELRDHIASSLSRLKQAESSFYAALAMRLHVMVRRQVVDRECWDFLRAGRDSLIPILGQNSTEWDSLGFAAGTQIPLEPSGRLAALCGLMRHLAKYPEKEAGGCHFTLSEAKRISRRMAAVLMEGESVRARLCAHAKAIHNEAKELRTGLQTARALLRAALHRGDPRWTVLRPARQKAVVHRRQREDLSGPQRAAGTPGRLSRWQPCPAEINMPASPATPNGNPTGKLTIYSAVAWLLPLEG